MVEYREYAELLGSPDSDKRGQAARIAAQAYLRHDGPENEHAALYAALLGFLDDESVRVRAALAFELLRTGEAPRPIMFALAYDARIIARAVVQYSPVLLDADLVGLIQGGDPGLRLAMAERENLGLPVISALIDCQDTALDMAILRRLECAIAPADLTRLAARHARDPAPRDLLLCRPDLPGAARLALVKQVGDQLSRLRIVKGAIGGRRGRIMGDALDHATTGPFATHDPGAEKFIAELAGNGALTPRLMIHSLVNGRHMFFAAAISYLAGVPLGKAEAVLARGGRAALNAVLAKAGLSEYNAILWPGWLFWPGMWIWAMIALPAILSLPP
ncbi:MAG: DUF2336 domain-containing protein [Alphaproteobacteria bacterium]|nr:DUF2336 domain-containing protein [Alphaproteobacteria bacterium]